MSLATKIGVALFLILAAALSMTTTLNYLRFEQTLRTLVVQQMNVVRHETSQDLLAGIDLGLRLENVENLDAILARRLQMTPEVTEITVQDCQGSSIATVRATQQPAPQNSIDHSQASFATSAQSSWTSISDQGAVSGTIMRDSLGQCAGQLIVTTDSSDYFQKLDLAFVEMWKSAGLGMLLIIPVTGLLIILMRRRHRIFVELHEDIDRAMAGETTTRPIHDKDALTASEIELISLYREIRDQLPKDGTSGLSPDAEKSK
ncbi:MAG: hypothetical protein ACMZ66_20450 [Thalassospira sp.]|uniref:hypothetical protein n=1 Tax=Thalassospira sp. TaxID=1912094 RepID=UPI003A873EDB